VLGWLILLGAAGAIEFGTWKITGKTLSQHLWRLQKERPWVRWGVLAGFAILTSHLVFQWP
jgi:hypothetical protein